MHPSAILHEAQQLYNVSDRLDLLAEQHPLVSEVLITIAGSVRNTATLLEVVSRRKWGCSPDQIQQMPDFIITVSIWALAFRRGSYS
jgi:hypothetical protein